VEEDAGIEFLPPPLQLVNEIAVRAQIDAMSPLLMCIT
jgi:hypothetical protein